MTQGIGAREYAEGCGVVELGRIGVSDVWLSVVGLGGAWLGHEPAEQEKVERARDVVRTAVDAGMNWVDTSENYYDTGNESFIGTVLRELPESVMVCSPEAGPRAEAVVEGLRRLAREEDVTVAQLAIAWVLRQPGVTSAVAGSNSVTHTRENAEAGRLVLADATLQVIEDLVLHTPEPRSRVPN